MDTTGQSITLANSIIGVGILAMPFCFQQCGVLLASLILLLMSLVSRICCHFLIKSALIAKRRNFEFLAFHVLGSAGKLGVELGIIGFLMGTCIAYFVVVGDLGPQIIAKMLNINQSDILRTSIMVLVSLVCVLPLGLLRNVDSLSNVCAATIAFYFCLVIKVISEAATQLLSTDWHIKIELWKPSGVLQCVPIFSMALFCQTQLFEIFESMPTLSLEKMNRVTKNAINICASVYFTLGLFGYIAFCSQDISGNILMSLSPTWASDVIKLGFVMSLAFSFPLIIFPCRASLYSFLYKKVHSYHHDHIVTHSIPATTFRCMTVAIIGVALFISLLLPNIELVLGLLGSTVGVLICVVFPAACFVHVTYKNTNERVLAKVVLVLGLGIMILGTYANLQAAEFKFDRYDDQIITPERIDKMVEDFVEELQRANVAIMSPDGKIKSINSAEQSNDVIKDSEIQPPNPVPPESISNENIQKPNLPKAEDKKIIEDKLSSVDVIKINDILPEDKLKEVYAEDKDSGSHPKNIKGKINNPNLNGNNGDDSNIGLKEVKITSSDDKMNMLKQQKLIETIKQHGEEQKELIKEQKEILHEIYKTKKELQQNKKDKDVDNSEAKKIAVESIQKIANMAIQSLSGVTETPDKQSEIVEKKSEPLEKIANEAVQVIAKKAVETIEAINENNEKSKDQLIVQQPSIPENNENKVKQNVQSQIDAQAIMSNILIKANSLGVPVANPPVPHSDVNINPSALNDNKEEKYQALPVASQQSNIGLKPEIKIKSPNQVIVEDKAHVHAPDEPQSYKVGENSQNKRIPNLKIDNIVQNVPIPIAMNNNVNNIINQNSEPKKQNIPEGKIENQQNVQNNGASKHSNVDNNLIDVKNEAGLRKKRETVDHTDKLISENQLKTHTVTDEILAKVDLNEALQKNILADFNSIHLRSLKSFTEGEEKR